MDFYTKLFLANIVAMISMVFIDRHILDDALEKTPVVSELLGLWVLTTALSSPVYFIWLITTW